IFHGYAVDDGSDVHEELRIFRDKRTHKRSPRSERISLSPNDVPLGEVESDIGFTETEYEDRSLIGKVGGDETFYYSSDAYSCETDKNDGQERENFAQRRASKRLMFDPSCKKVSMENPLAQIDLPPEEMMEA
ncbi:hypothetical protein HAX54_043730, partial [Datura stramonium]|nr:hypothetical protein [Datura stramonium]